MNDVTTYCSRRKFSLNLYPLLSSSKAKIFIEDETYSSRPHFVKQLRIVIL